MRIEVGGAQITETVAEVIETLQAQPDVAKSYLQTLDEVTRSLILDISGLDEESDLITMSHLRALQMIRRDIIALATPPELDAPENDVPTASF